MSNCVGHGLVQVAVAEREAYDGGMGAVGHGGVQRHAGCIGVETEQSRGADQAGRAVQTVRRHFHLPPSYGAGTAAPIAAILF